MRKWVRGDKSIAEAYARKTARELKKRGVVPMVETEKPKVILAGSRVGKTVPISVKKEKIKIKVKVVPEKKLKKLVRKLEVKPKKKEKKHGRRSNR